MPVDSMDPRTKAWGEHLARIASVEAMYDDVDRWPRLGLDAGSALRLRGDYRHSR